MHIAYFSPAWPSAGAANGIVTYVAQMKREVERLNHKVTVITPDCIYHHDGRATRYSVVHSSLAAKIWYKALPPKWRADFGTTIALAIKTHCPDIDLLEMEESFGWAMNVQDRLDLPVIVRLHGPNFLGQCDVLVGKELQESQFRSMQEGKAIQKAHFISAPSQQVLDETLRHYKANPAIGLAIFNPFEVTSGPRWQLFDKEKHHILHVGRFDRRKGADILLEAFALIADDYPEANLTIVGPDVGVQIHSGEKLKFREFSKRNIDTELLKRINFLSVQSSEAIVSLRVRTGICVVPSRFEVCPYSALESIAYGAPTVCVDGFADNFLVVEGISGWVARNGSARSLADAFVRAFECGPQIQQIAEAGRKHCIANFSTEVVGKKMLEFYESVLAYRRGI